MKVAVKDANLLIDLVEADLLGHWFKLGIETYTTNLVLHEITRSSQREIVGQFVKAGLLNVHVLAPGTMPLAAALALTWKMSIADASAMHLAQELKAALLTGDGAVRRAAQALRIEVHGVLWVLDLLVERSVITPALARISLSALMAGNSFLPRLDCQERLSRWGSK